MQNEFKLLAERKGEVEAALQKLVKKGKRFGVVHVTWSWGEAKFSQHVGKVGERLRGVKVQLKQAIGLPDNGFGPSTIYKFVDENKNRYTWFTSAGSNQEWAIDEWVLMTMTVKDHTEYQGILETRVSRAVISDLPKVCLTECVK